MYQIQQRPQSFEEQVDLIIENIQKLQNHHRLSLLLLNVVKQQLQEQERRCAKFSDFVLIISTYKRFTALLLSIIN